MKPQTIVRNSMHFVDRYAPELKLKYGYEPFHDNKVLGETVLTAYHDPEWVNLFMGDAVLDLDALFRVNGFECATCSPRLLVWKFSPRFRS